jgi:hypothetical protein
VAAATVLEESAVSTIVCAVASEAVAPVSTSSKAIIRCRFIIESLLGSSEINPHGTHCFSNG